MSCEVDFTNLLPKGSKNPPMQARALVIWWVSFQESTFRRKHPKWMVTTPMPEGLRIEGEGVNDTVGAKIQLGMRKIKVEDLGNMQAKDLRASIPEDDDQGRGMRDLKDMEKKLSLKIVFDDVGGHVYLVGDGKKLEKKAFAIRNMLSHYHWRLSGKDLAFSS